MLVKGCEGKYTPEHAALSHTVYGAVDKKRAVRSIGRNERH